MSLYLDDCIFQLLLGFMYISGIHASGKTTAFSIHIVMSSLKDITNVATK